MPSKPGRAPVSTSWKKGDKPALNNDKTAKLSVFFAKALKEAKTLTEYEGIRSQAEAIATDFVHSYWDAKTITDKKTVIEVLADRTEGKPKQITELSGIDGSPIEVDTIHTYSDEDLKNIVGSVSRTDPSSSKGTE